MRLNLALIGPEAAFPRERSRQRSGPRSAAEWVVWSSERTRCTHPPTPAPAGLTGPASLVGLLLAAGGWVYRYYPPWYPPTHTPPWYPPVHSPPSTARCGALGACTYDRFGNTVGEPRGLRTHPYSGPQTGLLRFSRFARPYDWFYDWFY